MIPMRREPLCVVCLQWTRYRAGNEGLATVYGTTLRIVPGDPVCLHHSLRDRRGRPLVIEETPREVELVR